MIDTLISIAVCLFLAGAFLAPVFAGYIGDGHGGYSKD